jgi:hypothetical protein
MNSGNPHSPGWFPAALQALVVKEQDKWLSHLVQAYLFSDLWLD